MSNTKQLTGAVVFFALIAVIDNFLVVESDPKLENMASIDAGVFKMGSETGLADERPVHEVSLEAFWIDKFEVSNRDFAKFIEATGHITQPEKGEGGLVFASPNESLAISLNPEKWWNLIASANWRHPNGSDGELAQINNENHPVVQVSFDEALAYCNWLGKDLPTEAQFEFAAIGGREGEIYTWGSQPLHLSEAVTNFWQGAENDEIANEGYTGTAPVGSYPPNAHQLYDISGNVWEWESDWYHPNYYAISEREDPRGIEPDKIVEGNSAAPAMRSIRGGSFLCSDEHCSGFRVSARMPVAPTSSSNHTGFRCVKNSKNSKY